MHPPNFRNGPLLFLLCTVLLFGFGLCGVVNAYRYKNTKKQHGPGGQPVRAFGRTDELNRAYGLSTPEGPEQKVTLSNGETIKLRLFGPLSSSRKGEIIAVHGMAEALHYEWADSGVATALAREGYLVITPNFHSNKRTVPGRTHEAVDWVNLIAEHYQLTQNKHYIFGKSWGTGIASHYACNYSKNALKVVLANPAFKEEETLRCIRDKGLEVLWLSNDDDGA